MKGRKYDYEQLCKLFFGIILDIDTVFTVHSHSLRYVSAATGVPLTSVHRIIHNYMNNMHHEAYLEVQKALDYNKYNRKGHSKGRK